MIDFNPGGPDGPPPLPERQRQGIWSKYVGPGIGIALAVVAIGFLVVAMLWAIAWMVTNFPGT